MNRVFLLEERLDHLLYEVSAIIHTIASTMPNDDATTMTKFAVSDMADNEDIVTRSLHHIWREVADALLEWDPVVETSEEALTMTLKLPPTFPSGSEASIDKCVNKVLVNGAVANWVTLTMANATPLWQSQYEDSMRMLRMLRNNRRGRINRRCSPF